MTAETSDSPPSVTSETRDTLLAVRNAFKLGGSLLFTWSIAIAVRLALPRHLGPARLGELSFADGFTIAFFVALGLGADVYVRKEVSVRPAHASDFAGGLLALRLLMAGVIFAVMAVVMRLSGRPREVQQLVYAFALAQFFVQNNSTLSALLHAVGRVDGMSVLAVATKVLWGLGVLGAIVTGAGLWAYAASYLASEAVETVGLFALARRHLGLVLRLHARATAAMILAGLPFYLNAFATGAYGKLDLALLGLLGTDREVGWYAAASTIAGLTLLAAPLLNWIVMPVFARAAARSRVELEARVRTTNELVLMVVVPISLLVNLGASECVRVLFGSAFLPAAAALRVLSPTFVLTHVAMVYAARLVMLGRAWTLTAISTGGLAVNAVLNVVLVRAAVGWFTEGGGGVGCALALLGTELFTTSTMLVLAGREALDRSMLATVGKSAAACAVVVVLDRLVAPLGWARLSVDLVAYLLLGIASGAIRTRAVAAVVVSAFQE